MKLSELQSYVKELAMFLLTVAEGLTSCFR